MLYERRFHDRNAQPGRHAGRHAHQDRPHQGALDFEPTILVPDEYLGSVLKLCQDRRGRQKTADLRRQARAMVVYDLPLERSGVRFLRPPEERVARLRLVRLQDRPAIRRERPRQTVGAGQFSEPVDALSMIVHRTRAETTRPFAMCEKLKELDSPSICSRFPMQAAIGGKVIARETIQGAAQGRDRQVLRRRYFS